MKEFEKSLAEVIPIIESVTSNWFLIGGSCLGYVRNRKFIGHDLDIDIGIFADQKIVHDLAKKLPMHTGYYYDGELKEMTLFLDCQIDIFFLFHYKEVIVETVFLREANKVRFFAYPKNVISDGVIRSKINDIPVNVLKQSIEYCKHLYGPDYLIEQKNWNCWSDPFNIVFEDHIISPEYVKNVPQLDGGNYFSALGEYLKIIAELCGHKKAYCPEPYFSLYYSAPGLITFLYVYARQFNDTVSENLGTVLLSRLNESVTTEYKNYTSGLVGYGSFLNYLSKDEFVAIENVEIFNEIDRYAIELIQNSPTDNNVELIGTLNYILSRLESQFDTELIPLLVTSLLDHLPTIYEFILDPGNVKDMSLDDYDMISSKAIILLGKITNAKMLRQDKSLQALIEKHDLTLKKSLLNLIVQKELSFLKLYAISNYLPDSCVPLIRITFDKQSFFNQPFKDNRVFFIPNIQAFIRMSVRFNKKVSDNVELHREINDRLFKNGTFDFDPYKRMSVYSNASLANGLSGLGLVFLSLLYEKYPKSLDWDSLLILS